MDSWAMGIVAKWNGRGSSGFTLLEVILVLVVVGVLAAMALPRFGNVSTEAKNATGTMSTNAKNTASECRARFGTNTAKADEVCGAATGNTINNK